MQKVQLLTARKPKLERGGWWQVNQALFQNASVKGRQWTPVTQTAFLFLTWLKGFGDTKGGAEQKKKKLTRQLQEKVLPRGYLPRIRSETHTEPKTPPKLLGPGVHTGPK